jgi:hypothetical protein
MFSNHPFDTTIFQLEIMVQAAPAVATGFQFFVPVIARCELVSVYFSLQTDGNAADRLVYVSPMQIGAVRNRFYASRIQVAGTLVDYSFYCGAPNDNIFVPVAGHITSALGSGVILDNIDQYQIQCLNIQAGDQFSGATLYYRQWLKGTIAV